MSLEDEGSSEEMKVSEPAPLPVVPASNRNGIQRSSLINTSSHHSTNPRISTLLSTGSDLGRKSVGAKSWALTPTIAEEIESPIKLELPPIQMCESPVRTSAPASARSSFGNRKAADDEDVESAFVLSRLENSPLDNVSGGSQTASVWITSQLKSAIQSLHSTMIGEISPDGIDWGTF